MDCLRVEAEKTSVNAALLDIESALLKVETAISALIEVSPLEMISHKTTSDQVIERLRVRFGVPKRIPSDILARLPNSLQGEGQLITANAKTGEAQAAYFPSISLTEAFDFES